MVPGYNSVAPEAQRDERGGVLMLCRRIKDKQAKYLRTLACATNQVWKHCNELSHQVFQRERCFMTGYDLQQYTSGASNEGLQFRSQTIPAIAAQYATRHKQQKKIRLAWRKSSGARRARFAASRSTRLAPPMPMPRAATAKYVVALD